MARLFGAARFWFVEWPEGCKDANALLLSDGPQALRDLVPTAPCNGRWLASIGCPNCLNQHR